MIELAIKSALAYLLGSIMGGHVIGRLRGGVDLRLAGSGNVGATNALRTQGRGFAAAVLFLDVAKGMVAVTIIPSLPWPLPGSIGADAMLLPFACGAFAALGHVYPAWYGFRGGKGAATLAGIFAVLLTPALSWMALAFAAVLILTGFVGLATVTAALTALLFVTCFHESGLFSAAGAFTLAMSVLVIYTHRRNLLNVWTGKENHFHKAMIFRKWLG